MSRFNNVLQKRINIESEQLKSQEALRNKYGIEDRSKTIVIEKASPVKLVIRLTEKAFRIASIILIAFFTALGIVSLLLPETRLFISTAFINTIKALMQNAPNYLQPSESKAMILEHIIPLSHVLTVP